MSKQIARNYGPGYLYVASNEFMPGLVKVGRTGGPIKYRLQSLFATGVPGRFKAESARFFTEVYGSERLMHETLSKLGKRCPNREFYDVSKSEAVAVLDGMYETQHERVRPYIFEWQIEEAFDRFLLDGNITSAEDAFNSINLLPEERRCGLKGQLLATTMDHGAEAYAIWLVSNKGIDPEVPIRNTRGRAAIPLYYLTAYEYSILLGLVKFEKYLSRRGCDLRNSTVLSLVIDVMINGARTLDSLSLCSDFAVELVNRGACIYWPITANIFSDVRIKSRGTEGFDFDIYPRDSNLSCLEIVRRLAPKDHWFARVFRAMTARVLANPYP